MFCNLLHILLGFLAFVENLCELDSCLSVQFVLLCEVLDLPIKCRHSAEYALHHVLDLEHQQPRWIPGALKAYPQGLHVLLEGFLAFLHLLIQSARCTIVNAEMLRKLCYLRSNARMFGCIIRIGSLARKLAD